MTSWRPTSTRPATAGSTESRTRAGTMRCSSTAPRRSGRPWARTTPTPSAARSTPRRTDRAPVLRTPRELAAVPGTEPSAGVGASVRGRPGQGRRPAAGTMGGVNPNRLRWGALAWLLTLQFFVVETIAQSRYAGPYSRADDTISALGTGHSAAHQLMNASFVLQAGLILAGALLLRPVLLR